jgi:hypothetical protein
VVVTPVEIVVNVPVREDEQFGTSFRFQLSASLEHSQIDRQICIIWFRLAGPGTENLFVS